MSWNAAVIDAGPSGSGIQVPVFGAPITVAGRTVSPLSSYEAGFHLNCAQAVLDATPAAAQYVVVPVAPVVVWASAPTVFLKFADEAEARGVLAGYWQDSTTGA